VVGSVIRRSAHGLGLHWRARDCFAFCVRIRGRVYRATGWMREAANGRCMQVDRVTMQTPTILANQSGCDGCLLGWM
jgi:hypothetical protein